jgi:hypothetical protein
MERRRYASAVSERQIANTSTRMCFMIKKTPSGYKVLSEKGKNLGGPYKSKKAAEKRLKQVEYFKHAK